MQSNTDPLPLKVLQGGQNDRALKDHACPGAAEGVHVTLHSFFLEMEMEDAEWRVWTPAFLAEALVGDWLRH